jgi:cytochrome b561
MALKSSPHRYGAVPIAIHWLSAAAILVMLGTGLTAANTTDPTALAGILAVHVSVGIAVLILTLLRIGWWLAVDRRPADKEGLPGWQATLSHIVHYGLYGVVVLMLASGVALALLSGVIPRLFNGSLAVLPDFTEYPPFFAHNIASRLLIGLVAVHVGAALYHQLWRQDRLLARMGLGHA